METEKLNDNSGLLSAMRHYSNPQVCIDEVASVKWPGGKPVCPRCESKKSSYLKTRFMWKCLDCKKQYSVKVGTIFEDSPIALNKWLCAMWMLANCKNGISSYEVARALEVTQKTAWFMLHRIRHAMKNGSIAKLSGAVEADETFIGGKLALMNKKAKMRKILRDGRLPGGGTVGKAIVMGLLERHGNARVQVIPTRDQFSVKHVVRQNVEPGARLYTDELQSYRGLIAEYAHEVIDHTEAYVKGQVHTNGMENFWSLFKRALKGTYVSVEPYHLQAYADEQCFRFNERKDTDRNRFGNVLNHVAGRRLTWNTLTGKEVG